MYVQLPRVELTEMGPRLDLSVRRRREAPPDLAKEAHRQPKLTGKKVGFPYRILGNRLVQACCCHPRWLRTKETVLGRPWHACGNQCVIALYTYTLQYCGCR